MLSRIILASTSPFRKKMLLDAGLQFDQVRPDLDERAVEQTVEGSGMTPADIAQLLAEAKALTVSEAHPHAIVIGADQTLSLDGEILHKPADMEEARRRLLALSGRTHELHSAVALCRNGEALWRHVSTAHMTMRQLDPAYVGRHLAAVGDAALGSVGAYQVEGRGIQLFERIEGDHFAIIGLPLLPLLGELLRQGIIDG